jgi:hypothetical protein
MQVRLVAEGDVRGSLWEFWKDVESAAVPSVGDSVRLGARTRSASELNERVVSRVRWEADLALAVVWLERLDPDWLSANMREFEAAGWRNVMAA